MKITARLFLLLSVCAGCDAATIDASITQNNLLEKMNAYPPLRQPIEATATPTGLTPAQIKKAYNLPSTGGVGTIAVVVAYDAPTIEADLNIFSAEFGLRECTTDNGCFEKYIFGTTGKNFDWALEATMDVEWAHAIAPDAKILLLEAKTNSHADLLAAINYARQQSDVVAVSMSWGSDEWLYETNYNNYFTSDYEMVFFAASGDSGHAVFWPAVVPQVVAVGGTKLVLASDGSVLDEIAWSGSSGGLSKYQAMPNDQIEYGVPDLHLRRGLDDNIVSEPRWRAIPDVSYQAGLKPGFSVYMTGTRGWYEIGGTSAGCPQWAAIQALDHSATRENLYHRAAANDYEKYFRDITKGNNAPCGAYCNARPRFDYVTGLGSPLTIDFRPTFTTDP